ncbi:alpha/beta fold hydrolase [Variovorax sp. Sphag1AA]|uniref:alpha/beta fold hydrolase n=1 Tax=Variovorax sp. Sphag1AA TaxID=2587027 RepID=UPI0016130D33|nr:alpha/beta hydrolase [Variovorax sp. Sphag1AA]MBB3181629.1 pimeloyl-ACP methyl ester carboxylesterase [Variovorax sp. Sphag1AA]
MPEPTVQMQLRSPDGLMVHVTEWGTPAGPEILFVHGIGASCAAWLAQVSSPALQRFRMVAYDLRGHGESDKPADASNYENPALWAEELHTVMQESKLVRPVVVAWSYGGRVLLDYVERFGCEGLAGVNFVAAMPINDPEFAGSALFSSERSQPRGGLSAQHAERAFVSRMTFLPRSVQHVDLAVETMLIVPASLKGALRHRARTTEEMLRSISCPVQLTHGLADSIILPSASRHAARHFPDARLSLYERCGHMPFLEHEARFNQELASFVDHAIEGAKPL